MKDIYNINPVVAPGFLDLGECRQIVEIFESGEKTSGLIRPVVRKEDEGPPDLRSIRNSTICWLQRTDETAWIYEKVTRLLIQVNAARYGFEIDTLQTIQLAEYKSTSQTGEEFYRSHMDIVTRGIAGVQRKLSLSAQLTNPEEYECGDLLLAGDKNDMLMDRNNFENNLRQRRQQGAAIIFPSFFEHEITPVTKGVRRSLVAWMQGTNWK